MPEESNSQAESLKSLQNDWLEVLVIGGGIVGAGVARDAAYRGLRTGLVEQQDFAAGTSSRSSRLLHGGIRYLAQGRLGLVREASREKTVIKRIAPHLVEPLAFIFPTRRWSTWSRWKLGIGVKIYDLLCGGRNFGASQILSRRKTLELLPGLSQKRLTGAVRYYDGLTNDARLTIDTLRSAAASGATVCNYLKLIGAKPAEDGWICTLQSATTGQELTVRSRCVVNATGPWSSRIPNSNANLRLTKGVHLVIDRSRLSVPDAVVIAEGQRILFAIPWGERVILGTTDTEYDGPLRTPACEPSDRDYVLAAVNEAFPEASLSQGDVLSAWAGIRPLVADADGDPSDISRRHEISQGKRGWWDVTGGKLTTYRLIAEETVDDIAEYLGSDAQQCSTAETPLLVSAVASRILPPEVSAEQVRQFCRDEWAIHLDDVMIRRTSWRHYCLDHLEVAERVALWMQSSLGWNDETKQRELHRYKNEISLHRDGPSNDVDEYRAENKDAMELT